MAVAAAVLAIALPVTASAKQRILTIQGGGFSIARTFGEGSSLDSIYGVDLATSTGDVQRDPFRLNFEGGWINTADRKVSATVAPAQTVTAMFQVESPSPHLAALAFNNVAIKIGARGATISGQAITPPATGSYKLLDVARGKLRKSRRYRYIYVGGATTVDPQLANLITATRGTSYGFPPVPPTFQLPPTTFKFK